jgi:hypothetical protein
MISEYAFPKQLYIGVENRQDFSTVDFPLAFATPYATDKAFANRKDSVDKWVGDGKTVEWLYNPDGSRQEEEYHYKDGLGNARIQKRHKNVVKQTGFHVPEVIDNIPQTGFSIGKAVSRYSTSNKWFEISDPRGFTLQINAYNLVDLMMNGTIINGNIDGEYIWARHGASWALVSTANQVYKDSLAPKIVTKIKPGDVIDTKNQKGLIYIGDRWVATFNLKEVRVGSYYDSRGIRYEHEHTLKIRNDKSYMLFITSDKYRAYKDKPSFRIVLKGSLPKEFDIKESGKVSDYIPKNNVPLVTSYHVGIKDTDMVYLFDTKQELNQANLDLETAKKDWIVVKQVGW